MYLPTNNDKNNKKNMLVILVPLRATSRACQRVTATINATNVIVTGIDYGY